MSSINGIFQMVKGHKLELTSPGAENLCFSQLLALVGQPALLTESFPPGCQSLTPELVTWEGDELEGNLAMAVLLYLNGPGAESPMDISLLPAEEDSALLDQAVPSPPGIIDSRKELPDSLPSKGEELPDSLPSKGEDEQTSPLEIVASPGKGHEQSSSLSPFFSLEEKYPGRSSPLQWEQVDSSPILPDAIPRRAVVGQDKEIMPASSQPPRDVPVIQGGPQAVSVASFTAKSPIPEENPTIQLEDPKSPEYTKLPQVPVKEVIHPEGERILTNPPAPGESLGETEPRPLPPEAEPQGVGFPPRELKGSGKISENLQGQAKAWDGSTLTSAPPDLEADNLLFKFGQPAAETEEKGAPLSPVPQGVKGEEKLSPGQKIIADIPPELQGSSESEGKNFARPAFPENNPSAVKTDEYREATTLPGDNAPRSGKETFAQSGEWRPTPGEVMVASNQTTSAPVVIEPSPVREIVLPGTNYEVIFRHIEEQLVKPAQGSKQIVITLDPPELGEIRLIVREQTNKSLEARLIFRGDVPQYLVDSLEARLSPLTRHDVRITVESNTGQVQQKNWEEGSSGRREQHHHKEKRGKKFTHDYYG